MDTSTFTASARSSMRDAELLLDAEHQFQRVDRVESEAAGPEQRRIIVDLLDRRGEIQTNGQDFPDLLFRFIHFQRVSSFFPVDEPGGMHLPAIFFIIRRETAPGNGKVFPENPVVPQTRNPRRLAAADPSGAIRIPECGRERRMPLTIINMERMKPFFLDGERPNGG